MKPFVTPSAHDPKNGSRTAQLAAVSCLLLGSLLGPAIAAELKSWNVPMGGNSYLTSGANGGSGRRGGGGGDISKSWSNPESVYSTYFRVDRPTILEISLRGKVPAGESAVRATVDGIPFEIKLTGDQESDLPLARVPVKKAGYVRVDLQGIAKAGPVFAMVDSLSVKPVGEGAADVKLDYVKDNESSRYYWGRRGPSVHLGYVLPKGEPSEWFYNEVTVPQGNDPVGSYFMSNGFGEGYFGMQVNGPDERRILFSVWSPFKTDKPGEIPEDQKIALLKKGEGVHGGEFGGEGSGGQSYWNFKWEAGKTYRFLNRVHPDGNGATVYTAWFMAPEFTEWKLIASFKRPKTDKYLTGPHSFLENFSDRQGYLGRSANYANQWSCDVKGEWHELTEAKFTGDDIANRRYRLDYAGGAIGSHFFMRNGGFFAETVAPGSRFTRESTADKKPVIDFKKLEGAEIE